MNFTEKKGTEVRRSRKNKNRVLKLVRRIHMYTGLILLPWVILFGFSGMLFNHPDLSGSVEVISSHSASEVDALKTFNEPNPDALADEILSKINEAEGLAFKRASSGDAVIEGALVYQGNAEDGKAVVTLSPNYGSAVVRQYPSSKDGAKPVFPKALEGGLAGYDSDGGAGVADRLFEAAGVEIEGDVETVERGAASVRFRIVSEDGKSRWNVSHNLVTGELSVREISAPLGVDLYELLTRLHKTHHYPDRFSTRWLWTAFGDATGVTMVFWGISGLIMWWQIKPTRVLGVAGLSVAAVVGFVIFAGTLSHNHWVPRQSKGGSPPKRSAAPGQEGAKGRPDPGEGIQKGERPKGTGPGQNPKGGRPDQGRVSQN
ncbi:PepSY domain-containing protein [Verrucomicrobiales bacterium BCK34]|nr:PepSY domain-containing protein [Verrucomicrobiales bacterium BCK34]